MLPQADLRAPPVALGWSRLLPYVTLAALLLWVFGDTALGMVRVWNDNDTYTHAFVVPPIVVWLVWRQRARLSQCRGEPSIAAVLLMALVCGVWLMGEAARVNAASHFALVALLVLAVPALYGWRITRELTFPLAFLFFAMPFGEFLVPQMMALTADFTVLSLRATGIPVYREGLQFVIPSGQWSVVQACSGVRYLIASVMVGSLFAYLNYQTAWRRWLFVAVAIVVPIVANWARAYIIVMLGHLSGNEIAAGADHLIYGWVFFGIVIGLTFFIGARWSEPAPDHDAVAPVGALPPASARQATVLVLVLAMSALGITKLLAERIARPVNTLTHDWQAPAPAPGWTQSTSAPLPWTPGFRAPSEQTAARFDRAGAPVWLWMAGFRQQDEAGKLVSSVNHVVDGADSRWSVVDSRHQTVALPDGPAALQSLTMRQLNTAADGAGLRLWQLYWTGGRIVQGDARVKLQQAFNVLAGQGGDGAVILLATPDQPDAERVLTEFLQSHWPTLSAQLNSARKAP